MILDHGASVTDTQLQIAKDAAQVILSAIDEHDKVLTTPVTPSTLSTSIGSFLNTLLKTLCFMVCVFQSTSKNDFEKTEWFTFYSCI